MVVGVGDEFQSQPRLTTYYTNGERLKGLVCCELSESVSIYTLNLGAKVSMGQAKFVPTHD